MPVPFEGAALTGTGSCGCHQQVMGGMTIVGGGAENGMSGSDFFLSGDAVAATSFFSSGYEPENHTADGMVGNESGAYAPQLDPAVVTLLESPCTIVLDVNFTGAGKGYIFCDGAVYLEIQIGAGLLFMSDNTAFHSEAIAAGRHKLALTRGDGAWSWSFDGGAVSTATSDALAAMGTVVLGVNGDTVPEDTHITEFTIYTTPQDDADLPGLSSL